MNYYALCIMCGIWNTIFFYANDNDDNYAQAVHTTMWATFLHKDKKLHEADQWYRTIIESPSCTYSLKGYILFLADMKNYKKIVSYIPRYTHQFAHDATVQATFAHALAQVGKQKESDELFINLAKTFPIQQDIVFQAIQAYTRKKDIDGALAIAHTIINKSPHKQSNFIFHFLQSQLYIHKGQLEKARDAAQQCVALHPHFFKGWLMVAALEEQLGNIDKAIHGYKSFLKTSNQYNVPIEQHILALTLKQTTINQKLSCNKPSLEKALFLFKQQQYQQALATINHCIKTEPFNPHNKLCKIQILLHMQHYDDTIALLTSWIKQEPEQQLWLSALHLLLHLNVPHTKIHEAFLSLHKQLPNNIWIPFYIADIYMREKKYDHALHYLDKASHIITDSMLKADLYFQMALIQFERGTFDMLPTILEKGLAEKDVLHAPLFNIAAYFYATKGKNIDRAEQLIVQALQLEPHNQHYLDTRAIILYKQGAYDKAESLLTGLLTQINHDSTMLLNMAKTKYKLGKIDEAHQFLQQAQSLVHNNYESAVLQKLKQKWQLP